MSLLTSAATRFMERADVMRTLNASKKGKGVRRFASKKELYADLGL